MKRWTQQVADSGLLEQLNALGPAIDAALQRDDNDQEFIDSLERIRTVLTFIGKRIDGADSSLLTTAGLKQLVDTLAATTGKVSAFAEGGDPDQLTEANTELDSALAVFASIVFPTKTNDLRGLREAADGYRDAMSSELAKFVAQLHARESSVRTLQAGVKELAERIDAEKDRLEGELTEFREKTEATQTELTRAYAQAEEHLKESGESAVAAMNQRFEDERETREAAHNASMEAQAAASEALLSKYDEKLNKTATSAKDQLDAQTTVHQVAYEALRSGYEEKAQATLETMAASLSRAQELVGLIGDVGVTSGHKTAADEAAKQVVFWHRVTLWSMLALIVFAGATALELFESNFSWLGFARRIYFSLAVGALATYGASQANRYQLVERRNRKLELELKALGPFLEPVAPAEREKFRLKIAEVFFGTQDGHTGEPGPATALHALASKENLEVLGNLVAAVNKGRK